MAGFFRWLRLRPVHDGVADNLHDETALLQAKAVSSERLIHNLAEAFAICRRRGGGTAIVDTGFDLGGTCREHDENLALTVPVSINVLDNTNRENRAPAVLAVPNLDSDCSGIWIEPAATSTHDDDANPNPRGLPHSTDLPSLR